MICMCLFVKLIYQCHRLLGRDDAFGVGVASGCRLVGCRYSDRWSYSCVGEGGEKRERERERDEIEKACMFMARMSCFRLRHHG